MPDSMSLPTLACCYIRTGDILYTPMGVVTIDKIVQDDSVVVRRMLWERGVAKKQQGFPFFGFLGGAVVRIRT